MTDRVDMQRTSSPMRLALLRAAGAWLFVGTPVALCAATVAHDSMVLWRTSAWLVLAGHAGLGVGAASLWALPFAGMTYERLSPGSAPVHVLIALFSLAVGLPAAVALSACYPAASALDRWLGRPPAGTAA